MLNRVPSCTSLVLFYHRTLFTIQMKHDHVASFLQTLLMSWGVFINRNTPLSSQALLFGNKYETNLCMQGTLHSVECSQNCHTS